MGLATADWIRLETRCRQPLPSQAQRLFNSLTQVHQDLYKYLYIYMYIACVYYVHSSAYTAYIYIVCIHIISHCYLPNHTQKTKKNWSRTPCTHRCCHHYHWSTTVGRLLGIRQGLVEAAKLLVLLDTFTDKKTGGKGKVLGKYIKCFQIGRVAKFPGWGGCFFSRNAE